MDSSDAETPRRLASGVHILLACMPKSGSTFLADVISQAPGFHRAQLYPSSDRREQELDEYCLRAVDKLDYVGQCHVRYSEWTARMVRDFRLTPVILVRSLLDVIVSLRDHVRRQSPIWPMVFVEPAHANLSDAELELMLARLATPWLINFYMGWRQVPCARMVSYEELIRDPSGVVQSILLFSGAAPPPPAIETAVQCVRLAGGSGLNIGSPGRGAQLRAETIRAVIEAIDFYPAASGDPFIVAVKSQADAALGGRPSSAWPSSVALTPCLEGRRTGLARRWMRKSAKRLILGRLLPIAAIVFALLYWAIPNDLLPDVKPYGFVDDGFVLMICGFIAGGLLFRIAPQRKAPRRRAARSGASARHGSSSLPANRPGVQAR